MAPGGCPASRSPKPGRLEGAANKRWRFLSPEAGEKSLIEGVATAGLANEALGLVLVRFLTGVWVRTGFAVNLFFLTGPTGVAESVELEEESGTSGVLVARSNEPGLAKTCFEAVLTDCSTAVRA